MMARFIPTIRKSKIRSDKRWRQPLDNATTRYAISLAWLYLRYPTDFKILTANPSVSSYFLTQAQSASDDKYHEMDVVTSHLCVGLIRIERGC